MKPKKRSFLLTGVLVVLVGVAFASGGLQIPKALNALAKVAGIAPAPIADAEEAVAVPRIAAASDSYAAGDVVTLRGSGWQPNEVVTLIDAGGKKLGSVVAGEDGSFVVEFNSQAQPGTKLLVLAKGIEGSVGTIVTFSLPNAQQISIIDFSQCRNGDDPAEHGCVEWINGILNAGNSHYAEDNSVPQRAVWSVPNATVRGVPSPLTGRTVDFTFEARKKGVHAYDSVTRYDNTQTAIYQDLCLGLAAADCVPAGTNGTLSALGEGTGDDVVPSCVHVPDDTTVVADNLGAGSATTGHMLDPRFICMWTSPPGGVITNISAPTHSDAACPAACQDDLANFIITYSVPSVPAKVFLAYGGHTAASEGPRGWGIGVGSGSVSGGPYHFKWTSADGDSIGNRDNQIQSGALEATATPTSTNTPTNTPTDTPTNTPTDTPTDTPTNTPTDTPTNTPTDTPTNTPTDTPTNTPTNTPTDTPTPTNTPTNTPTPIGQGCSPGFFKNHETTPPWCNNYTPDTLITSVWTVNCGNCDFTGFTFDDALNGSSGKSLCDAITKLFQQGVAALLSSCSLGGNYPLTTQQVLDQVQAALDTCDRKDILAKASELQIYNSTLPCPLGSSFGSLRFSTSTVATDREASADYGSFWVGL